jgi:hypothetical protein
LTSLVDRGLVLVLDLLLLRKDADALVSVDELHQVDATALGQLRAFDAELALLLAEKDVEEIGKVLEPATPRRCWSSEQLAGPFASAVRRSGGQLIADGRVPTQALLAAIEAEQEIDKVGA